MPGWNCQKKNKQGKAKQHPEAELYSLKIIRFPHPLYHANIIGDIFLKCTNTMHKSVSMSSYD